MGTVSPQGPPLMLIVILESIHSYSYNFKYQWCMQMQYILMMLLLEFADILQANQLFLELL